MRKAVPFVVIVTILWSAPAVLAAGGGDIQFSLTKADPVLFSHDLHLKAKGLKCAACHFQKFSKGAGYEMKKETITKREFCEHCHNGMKAFDAGSTKNCARCHKK